MDLIEAAWQGKAARVYVQLRKDIEEGVLPPGQTLSETQLVEYTGASRTPVREAIHRLATEGLIDLAPRRAPTVSRISLGNARALFDYRRILEPAAIAAVTLRAAKDDATRNEFVALRERFRKLHGDDRAADFDLQFAEATAEFDRLLARRTPNEYLGREITDLRPHSARLRNIAHGDRERLAESITEHVVMCSAILAGDSKGAAEAMTVHLNHVEQSIFRQLIGAEAGTPASEWLVS